MIKNRKSTSYKNRSTNKNRSTYKKSNRSKSSKVFMKKSFISPSLQINELNHENFIESPAPVAPHVLTLTCLPALRSSTGLHTPL